MKTIAYVSPFVPPEWIAAHGFRPHRLRLRTTEELLRGVCPYAGAMADAAFRGLDAAALVLTTVCDQMRYVAAMVESRNCCPTFLLNVPSTWQTVSARNLYLDELRRLGRFLVEQGDHAPSDTELARVMLECDGKRNHGSWSGSCTAIPTTGIPLALLGGPMMEGDDILFDLIKQLGGRVVLDATEGSPRTMPRPFDPVRVASNPLEELADAYFEGIPDVFRRPNNQLYEWLDRELSAKQVRGILFRRYLWCDLWHAELQRLKQWSRLPVLEIDVGPDDFSAPNRVMGRIEAFLEMLK